MSLPLIDYSSLVSTDASIRTKEIKKLDKACREIGFVYLINHDIPTELIDSLKEAAKLYFDLPLDEKKKIDICNSPNHRGYGPIGEENLEEGAPKDWKETFDMALNLDSAHPLVAKYPKMYGPNRYPDDSKIVDTLHQYYKSAFHVSQNFLKAMALALQLDEDFFTRNFNEHVTVLRMIHYPPRPSKQHDNGAGAHTDYGCITLLLQDDVGGLQVKSRDGLWVDATPIEGSIVVNIGDLMQRWTNDAYVSTAHRVIASNVNCHRYSFPFFVEPDYETVVECVQSCQSENNPAKYERIFSGDWIQSRFDATYSYRDKSAS
ncbi:2OG-Fe(II) oxygenase [Marinomonas agarivorans]|nr:2OG-Fe(II) oxygenase [Marinomonas agarivorans]